MPLIAQYALSRLHSPGVRRSTPRRSVRLALILSASLPAMAAAQTYQPPGLAPVHETIDANGVDLSRGMLVDRVHSVSIGDPNDPGMVFSRSVVSNGTYRDSVSSAVTASGSTITVNLAGDTETFTQSGSSYTSDQKTGSTLTYAGGAYTYTLSNGTTAVLNSVAARSMYGLNSPVVTSLTRPNGEVLTYSYHAVTVCAHYTGSTCTAHVDVARLQAVSSNRGYMLRLSFLNDDTDPIDLTDTADWMTIEKATVFNTTVDYCDPAAVSCSYSTNWPSLTMNATSSFTDSLGRVTTYTYASGRLTAIKRPGASSANVSIAYDGTGKVSSVTRDGVTTTYAYSDMSGVRTTTVNAAGPETRVLTFDLATMLRKTDQDALLNKTTFAYDPTTQLLTDITAPELNVTHYEYDSRGNVTSITSKAKPGASVPDIVQQMTYPASDPTYPDRCTSGTTAVVCNQPLTMTDPRGNVTNFSYDSGHGGVLSVTRPAPMSGGTRPQTRYSYTPLYAWYQTGGGTQVQAPTPIQRLTSVSQCITGASCAGTADETLSVAAYEAGSGSVGSNLLPVIVTAKAGDSSLSSTTTLTHDAVGNVTAVDGPLSGTSDTTYRRYDLDRETVGTIAPDPDDTGPRKRLAQRLTYNADGQVTVTELGTVNGVTDADWSAFVSLQQSTASYDANARTTSTALTAGGTTYGLTLYSYDERGRPDCTAVRMNMTTGGGVAACTLDAVGAAGPDQISRTSYDAVGRANKVQSAVGTSSPSDDATGTYTANGKLATLADANANLTTYEYDGFDRLAKTRYPVTTTGSGTSSTTDYEQLGYDAGSNVTSRRLRDGQTVTYTIDALGRMIGRNLPMTDSYAYDLLGRLTNATDGNGVIASYGYDALGRKITEQSSYGMARTMQYDTGGRRIRLTWADGLYTAYDYDTLGEMTAVRENGATSGIGILATYAYDDLGHRTGTVRGNGTTTSYGFDTASRLTALSHDLGGTSYDVNYGFGYNAAGQIASRSMSNDAYAWTGAANRNDASAVNGLNQVTTVGAGTLGYDARGNITSTGGNTYTYNTDNKLSGFPGGYIYYNALGQWLDINTEQRAMIYDNDQAIGEVGYDGVIKRRYVYGPGTDEPIVWYEGSGTGDRRWLHADERGSVVAVSDASGNTLAVNTYDEYGVPGSGNIGRFQYTGQAYIPDIGTYYYKARMYAARLGRFLQTDPIGYGDGMNRYGYVGGDPVNLSDPSGLVAKATAPVVPKCDDPESASCQDDIIVNGFGGGGGTYLCNGYCGLGLGYPTFGQSLAPPSAPQPGASGGIAPQNDDIVVTGRRFRKVATFAGTDGTFQCTFYGGNYVQVKGQNTNLYIERLDAGLSSLGVSKSGQIIPAYRPSGYQGEIQSSIVGPYSTVTLNFSSGYPSESGLFLYSAHGRTNEFSVNDGNTIMNISILTNGGTGGCLKN